jgi:hypothetical protein
LAKAAAKNGASNVDPAPARVGFWPPGPVLTAATAEEVPVLVVVLVLLQAAMARTVIAAAAAQMAGWVGWRGEAPGRAWCADMVVFLCAEGLERG